MWYETKIRNRLPFSHRVADPLPQDLYRFHKNQYNGFFFLRTDRRVEIWWFVSANVPKVVRL